MTVGRNRVDGTNKIGEGAVEGRKLSGGQRTLWAAVRPNGTIADQSGGIKVEGGNHGGNGVYDVDFGKDVSGRALVVTGTGPQQVVDVDICNGGTGIGIDYSPHYPNDNKHAAVVVRQAASVPTARVGREFPFYVAALPK